MSFFRYIHWRPLQNFIYSGLGQSSQHKTFSFDFGGLQNTISNQISLYNFGDEPSTSLELNKIEPFCWTENEEHQLQRLGQYATSVPFWIDYSFRNNDLARSNVIAPAVLDSQHLVYKCKRWLLESFLQKGKSFITDLTLEDTSKTHCPVPSDVHQDDYEAPSSEEIGRKSGRNVHSEKADCLISSKGCRSGYIKEIPLLIPSKKSDKSALGALGIEQELKNINEKILARYHANLGINLVTKGDYVNAMRYLRYAAKLKDAEAIHNLGFAYENGIGLSRNEKKAFKLYKKAAKLGYSVSLYNVALYLEEGRGGVMKDLKRASEIYSYLENVKSTEDVMKDRNSDCKYCDFLGWDAKEQNEKQSPPNKKAFETTFRMARAYHFGLGGLKKDLFYALELYRAAAKGGHYKARTAYIFLRSELFGEEANFLESSKNSPYTGTLKNQENASETFVKSEIRSKSHTLSKLN